jgi:hypothetical protein
MDIAAHIIDLYFLKGDSFLFRAGLGTEFLALALLMALVSGGNLCGFLFWRGLGTFIFLRLGDDGFCFDRGTPVRDLIFFSELGASCSFLSRP